MGHQMKLKLIREGLLVITPPEVPSISVCILYGGARGVMVTVLGNAHGDMSSNPGPG